MRRVLGFLSVVVAVLLLSGPSPALAQGRSEVLVVGME